MFVFRRVTLERVILHIDANCFYASVECFLNPDIRDKPVAIIGDVEKRHGIVLAANYIAKFNFNIRTAETVWSAKTKCPNLVLIRANMPLYMKFSKRMKNIILDYTDRVESFGCDENFADITNSKIFGTPEEIAKKISLRIKDELGISVSIGISFNKVFAKIGSDYKKPDGITSITKDNFKQIVWKMPVGSLLYAGKKSVSFLNKRGIFTIGDVANSNVNILEKWLGKSGKMLYDFANGLDSEAVSHFEEHRDVKSISNSMTMIRDLNTNDEIKAAVYSVAEQVAARARGKGLKGNVIGILIKNNEFEHFTRQVKIDFHTDSTGVIAKEAMQLFCENFKWDKPIRQVGVFLTGLENDACELQLSIYDDYEKADKMHKLDTVQDILKMRFGEGCITRGILIKNKDILKF